MSVQKHTKDRIGQAFTLIAACLLLGFFLTHSCAAEPVSPEKVWAAAQSCATAQGIDPLLVYAIACAESSLDAHASSGHARGLMQMTKQAWKDVTKRPYQDAWDWEANMDAATLYLGMLKRRLEKHGRYSWSLLACAYRYGPGAVEKADYDISRLPKERNRIYSALFAGKTPRLPSPAPFRNIVSVYPPRPEVPMVVKLPDVGELPELPAIIEDWNDPDWLEPEAGVDEDQ